MCVVNRSKSNESNAVHVVRCPWSVPSPSDRLLRWARTSARSETSPTRDDELPAATAAAPPRPNEGNALEARPAEGTRPSRRLWLCCCSSPQHRQVPAPVPHWGTVTHMGSASPPTKRASASMGGVLPQTCPSTKRRTAPNVRVQPLEPPSLFCTPHHTFSCVL